MTELWAPKDIQRELGRSRSVVAGYQTDVTFPKPVLTVGLIRLYDAASVRAWWADVSGINTRAKVVRYARKHGVTKAARRYDVPPATIYRWLKK